MGYTCQCRVYGEHRISETDLKMMEVSQSSSYVIADIEKRCRKPQNWNKKEQEGAPRQTESVGLGHILIGRNGF